MKIAKPGEVEREVIVVPTEEPIYKPVDVPVESPEPIPNSYSNTAI